MKVLRHGAGDECIQCRCRIEGHYMGRDFIYEDPEHADGWYYFWVKHQDPSTYWWAEGNMSCDCNRYIFLPADLQALHDGKCGESIMIKRIIPLEGDNLPILDLTQINE